MNNTMGFIDFSDSGRELIQKMFAELASGTLDELGIAPIRDAFSNKLFPGTSVLQKRAKYYFIIPYIFKELEAQYKSSIDEYRQAFYKMEKEFTEILRLKSPEETGIHGSSLPKEGFLATKPHQIYWNGMKTYGILESDITTTGAFRLLASRERISSSKGNDFTPENTIRFNPEYCKFPDNFKEDCEIALTHKEAHTLKHTFTSKGGVLAALISHYLDKKRQLPNGFDSIPLEILGDNKDLYLAAIDFSNFSHGIQLKYNLLLSSPKMDTNTISQEFSEWKQKFKNTPVDLDHIFAIAGRSDSASLLEFYKKIEHCVKKEKPFDQLIIDREKALKGDKAKLEKEYVGAPVNIHKLSFRYETVKRILEDIAAGLSRV